MIKVEKFVVNPLGENSFIISDETSECIFIDPGFYYEEEHKKIKEDGLLFYLAYETKTIPLPL